MKRIRILLILLFLSISCLNACNTQTTVDSSTPKPNQYNKTIDLKKLKAADGFQFYDLSWNSNVSEVENILGNIEKAMDVQEISNIYYVTESYCLLNENADITLEFSDTKLRLIEIQVQNKTPNNTNSFFNKLIKEAIVLYGEYNSNVKIDENLNIIYWQIKSENYITSLQVARDTDANCTVLSLLYEELDNNVETTISLGDLKTNDSYSYALIPWNISKADFEKRLGNSLELLLQENVTEVYKVPGDVHLIETGTEASIELTFSNKKLQKLTICMTESDNNSAQQLYLILKKALVDMYGEAQKVDCTSDQELFIWSSETATADTQMNLLRTTNEVQISICILI